MSHSKGSGDDKTSAEEQATLFGTVVKPRAAPDDRIGHRRRLRDRFQNGGSDAVPDYELLEMILFRAFPRIDTKPIAKRLIARFGSFAEVVSAPAERLKEIEGIGDRAVEELKLIKAAAERLTKGEIRARPAVSSWTGVLDYLRLAQGFEAREQFRILVLDK
jgi:DNA repair protein RadC